MGSPWQWVQAALGAIKPRSGKGSYLGSINNNWNLNGEFLPRDDYYKLRSKTRVGDIAVANWCWKHDYPDSHHLNRIWFEPFLVLFKEVPWHFRKDAK